MAMKQFLLNSGSTIEEGRLAKGGSKLSPEYTAECAAAEMNPEDYEALGSPERVLISSPDGRRRVAVHAYAGPSVSSGHIFMPRAIWANVVVDPETFSTGSPLYKGSPVLVEATEEEVLDALDLVNKLYGRGR
ncbi:MAG: formylmethanofuran dehydrogenase [Methanothrix sp.]|nr:formylmethanofuran dehydrogenase [Methanothrix sp.]